MGFSDKLITVGGAVAVASKLYFDYRQMQESNRRKNSPIRFDNGVGPEDFERMTSEVTERTPRIRSSRVRGMEVVLVVRSNSGLTTWESVVDFNDYGRLTGKYWLTAENSDSLIPEHFAGALAARIRSHLASREIEPLPEG